MAAMNETVKQTHVHVQLPQSMSTPQLGPRSAHMVCPSCGEDIRTITTRNVKAGAWWGCILLCILGFACGCCLIPCCMDSCNVVNHTCPKCKAYLGQFRP